MTAATKVKPDPKRLEIAKGLPLDSGGHDAPKKPSEPGKACFMEREGWIYGEKWGACPPCVSPVLWNFSQRLNDRLAYEPRQELRRFLGRTGGTAGDGQDAARRAIAASWVINTGLPNWLELAGLTVRADELRAMEVTEWTPALRDLLWEIRGEAREATTGARGRLRKEIEKRVREKLEKDGKPAAAAADAAAAAVAVAVAAAAADAAAAAVAVAVAAADAVADAAAVAVAVAVAVADAVAVAVADAVAAPYSTRWTAVYNAVRNDEKVKAEIEKAVPFLDEHREAALGLFEQLIDPSKVEAVA